MFTPSRRFATASCFVLTLLVMSGAMGAKPGGGGGGGGGVCTDAFPSFAYEASGNIMLSSANACRRELLLAAHPDRRGWSIHFSADRQSGVLVLREDPGNAARYVMRRLDFTVLASGTLEVAPPVTVLPLPEEEVPSGDQLFYSGDVWGNADHSALFLSARRTHVASDGVTSSKWIIYDLNEPTQFRVVFDGGSDASPATWGTCSAVAHPQFVAGCYQGQQAGAMRFTAAGTRLYFSGYLGGIGSGWAAQLRREVDNTDSGGNLLPLSAWTFGEPELVLTAPREAAATYSEVNLWGTRQLDGSGAAQQPDPEYAGISYLDRTGKQTVRKGLFIDADRCVQAYINRDLTGGANSGPIDVWRTDCTPMISFHHAYAAEARSAWQSADAILQSVPGRRTTDIHRRHVTGPLTGYSQVLIEGGSFPDAGL